MVRDATKPDEKQPVTTAKVSEDVRGRIESLALWGESVDGTLRRVLGMSGRHGTRADGPRDAGRRNGRPRTVKISPEVRRRIESLSREKESVNATLSRVLPKRRRAANA